jgi:phosphate/sulfate permease
MARDLVPLGPVTATLAAVVTGSVLLVASWIGVPQSLVHINAASVAAISLAKEGSWQLMPRRVLMRVGILWVVTPLIAAALTSLFLRLVPR